MNRRAFLRLAAGFKFGIDQQIPGFTVGTYAGPGTVNGANQSGSSLLTHGWTSGSVSLNPGDRFTIAGVSIPSLRHSRLHGLSAQKPIP